jgi:hypothetical protein
MKKRTKKIKRNKQASNTDKDKKIEVQEYVDSITDVEDNTNPDYPFDEDKPIVIREGNNKNS